jgi:restriction system protein
MAVPVFQSLTLPVLKACASGPMTSEDLRAHVSKQIGLSEEDLALRLPSGTQTTFANRVAWASVYLQKAALLKRVRKGVYEITDVGKSVLAAPPVQIDLQYLEKFPAYVEWKSKTKQAQEASAPDAGQDIKAVESETNPEERLDQSYNDLTTALETEMLERLLAVTPTQFEQIIVDLLVAMNYGGGRAEMAKALGRTGDGGVDGVVREDPLGLDVVYMQAKRYGLNNTVQIAEVREFIGSIDNKKATKGVFVTTSKFVKSAYEEVKGGSKRVALIDGSELARLMVEHGVGVRSKSTYVVKEIDEDYFEE